MPQTRCGLSTPFRFPFSPRLPRAQCDADAISQHGLGPRVKRVMVSLQPLPVQATTARPGSCSASAHRTAPHSCTGGFLQFPFVLFPLQLRGSQASWVPGRGWGKVYRGCQGSLPFAVQLWHQSPAKVSFLELLWKKDTERGPDGYRKSVSQSFFLGSWAGLGPRE